MKFTIKEIRFNNYKSFKGDYIPFKLEKFTLLIGRNNCGKSSILDVFESITSPEFFYNHKCCVQVDINGQKVRNEPFSGYKKYVGDKTVKLEPMKTSDNYTFKCNLIEGNYETIFFDAEPQVSNFFQMISFRRLNADRDIVPESYNSDYHLDENGNGACNLINQILTKEPLPEKLIHKNLLEALNKIMYPDSKFDGITVQKSVRNDNWEVYLYEGDERFALSKMGSGLKTIILVLLNLIIIPEINRYNDENMHFFAFEELENNLHPALQRRLFRYICQYGKDHLNTYIFLTTHSHVAINIFADNPNTQILHVKKENEYSTIDKIDDFISKSHILEDLDVRASDLFQSNGIIWVEGPSDRIYIKRWLEIWGDKELIEGSDYQFLYYGGRLLSHYTTEEAENLINILLTNRNSVIVIDSDKKSKQGHINDTKKRIQKEFEGKGMFCWITKGKEIENYLPFDAINAAYSSKLTTNCKQYELFPNYIENVCKDFSGKKLSLPKK
ncbi:AAA family ATPase [Ruminococcus sp.]|uniref:ATP-dependent nuclease n=1 Tax=Ruminococcus sp. TaxID=41978 RepID=UPI0025FA8F0A|nr:AAA family ATPase [Ruminococcus sp.]